MEVRAAVAHKAGEPLSIETVQLDGPKAGEVLVEVKATGICHTDEFTLSGGDPEGIFPSILGHEGAGVVVDVGPEVRQYCVDLVTATRRMPELRLGASPRATLQLVRAARAQAALQGRGFVVPDDVRAVAVPVLAHRLLLAPDARAARRSTPELGHGLLTRLPVPAPARS